MPTGDLVATVGAALGVVLALLAILGAAWRYVVLPNLREQLIRPLEETRRQVSENKHRNRPPTLLDRIDDVETTLVDITQTLEAIAVTQQAQMRQLGEHVHESVDDRRRLWQNIASLQAHRKRQGRKQKDGAKRSDTGGA